MLEGVLQGVATHRFSSQGPRKNVSVPHRSIKSYAEQNTADVSPNLCLFRARVSTTNMGTYIHEAGLGRLPPVVPAQLLLCSCFGSACLLFGHKPPSLAGLGLAGHEERHRPGAERRSSRRTLAFLLLGLAPSKSDLSDDILLTLNFPTSAQARNDTF